jgi:hypothetical protein
MAEQEHAARLGLIALRQAPLPRNAQLLIGIGRV